MCFHLINTRRIFLFASVLVSCSARAQEPDPAVLEKYKNENAVILNHSEHVTFKYKSGELKSSTEVNTETLILSDAGAAIYNSLSVPHSYYHHLTSVSGSAIIPSDRGYKTVKATDYRTVKATADGVFYDDAQQTLISYPALKKGARMVAEYELENKDVHFLPGYYFPSYLPVVHASYSITAPKTVHLGWQLRGLDTGKVMFSTEEDRNSVTYTWSAADVPKYKSFDNAPSFAYYLPHLLVYVKDYQPEKDEQPVNVFGTIEDLYRFYYPFIADINQNIPATFKALVTSVTAGAQTEQDKAAAIYHYVQNNIRYVAFEDGIGGFKPRDAVAICDRKYGDCKDMTSLLVTMCREAGLEAYFTWIGTRNKPYEYHQTPLPVTDDHMICAIRTGKSWLFLDGTDSFIPFGIPPYGIQGKQALVGISKDKYELVDVPVIGPEKNILADTTLLTVSGTSITGTVSMRLKGYAAWNMEGRMQYKNEKELEQAMKSFLIRGSNKYMQKDFQYRTADSTGKDFLATAAFELPDYTRKAGKELYVNMNIQRTLEDSWIDTKDRNVAVENDYKHVWSQVVVINIPKGYHVSYLPPSVERTEPDLLGFRIGYKVAGNQIILNKELTVNALYVQPGQFASHNKLVEELKKQYKESVVLTED